MTTETILKTKLRAVLGSAQARRERVAGRIPVNVYGHGEKNRLLTIGAHELVLALHGPTQVFELQIGRSKAHCLVKEVQYDALGQDVLHVDFARVSMTEEVEVEVPLTFTGHAPGVSDGGTLAVHHPALWVRCLANAIPEALEVDVSELGMGQGLQAGSVVLPDGVSLDTDRMHAGDPIVGVLAPRGVAEAEEAAEGEAAEGEGAEEGAETPSGEEGDATPSDQDKHKKEG